MAARVVPWQDRKEWQDVYSWLYSNGNTSLQRRGIQRVAAWRSRSSGKLPVSIDATVNLVTARVHHSERSESSPAESQMVLAMALIRFVSGMTDMEQKKVYARSVQSIAAELGIPEWLVELRHESTHTGLPSIDTLLAGVEFALSWLRENYWDAQESEFFEKAEKLWECLQKFKTVQEIFLHTKDMKAKKWKKRDRARVLLAIEQMTHPESFSECLFPLLLQEGCLISEQVQTPSNENNNTVNDSDSLPPQTIKLWIKVFKTLQSKYPVFTPLFTKYLIGCFQCSTPQEQQADPRYKELAHWLKYFFKECEKVDESCLQEAMFSWHDCIHDCLHLMNATVSTFVQEILCHVNQLNGQRKQKIEFLVQTAIDMGKFGVIDDFTHPSSKPHIDSNDLKEVFEKEYERLSELTKLVESSKKGGTSEEDTVGEAENEGWEMASDLSRKWFFQPLGTVIGSLEPSSTALELTEESGHVPVPPVVDVQPVSLEDPAVLMETASSVSDSDEDYLLDSSMSEVVGSNSENASEKEQNDTEEECMVSSECESLLDEIILPF